MYTSTRVFVVITVPFNSHLGLTLFSVKCIDEDVDW